MANNILQSSYPDGQKRGLPGNRANAKGELGDTWISDDADNIPFGRAVSRSGDKTCVLGGSDFIGIAAADPAKDGMPLTFAAQGGSSQADYYVRYDNVCVANDGDWFVLPGADVDPTDVVAYSSTTGVIGPHRLSATYDVVIAGAKFMDTVTLASGNVARVRFSQPQGNNVVSI